MKSLETNSFLKLSSSELVNIDGGGLWFFRFPFAFNLVPTWRSSDMYAGRIV